MKKKLLTILLSAFVMMAAFTTRVFAATTVSTWDELKTAIGASIAGEVITLGGDITVTDTYTIEDGKDITIELNGQTINGNGNQIFILSGKLKIQDSAGGGTITGGANSGGSGGAVAIKGTGELTLESGTFTGNSAKFGGAISIDEGGGKFIMNGGKISGNTSSDNGAGIYVGLLDTTYIEMNGGEISGNTSSRFGGGIYINNTEMQLNGGKIINNTALIGAGICVSNSSNTKLYLGGNSVVKDNTNSSGGDIDNIYLYGINSTLYISTTNPLTSGAELYVTIRTNTTGDWGPGIDVGHYFNSTMTDSNYQYFYFTNCGNVEKNTVYSVTKSGGNYVTAAPKCKIDTTEYPTLDAALAAVTSGQTITMLEDISYTDGTNFVIDGETVTIDFNGHSMAVNTGSGIPTVNKLFTVTNSGNLTTINGETKLIGNYSSIITSFTVSGTNSVLTLKNMKQTENADRLLTNDGGKVYIDGGVYGYGTSTNVKLAVTNGGTLNIKGGASFKFQTELVIMGQSSNSNPDTDMGSVIIDSATLEQAGGDTNAIRLYGKANVTLNEGVWTGNGSYSSLINIGNYGYKSNVTINNFTSDSPYAFISASNPNIENFTATVNDGHYKYTKGQFAIDRNNSLKPNIKLNGGYYGPDTADDDALTELTAMCASGYQVEVLDTTDPEYANGYRYKVYNNNPAPTPTPEPSQDSSPRYAIPNTGVEETPNNHSLLKLSSLSLLAIGTYMVIKKKKDND